LFAACGNFQEYELMNAQPLGQFVNESRFRSVQYILTGALYGFLIGIALVATATFVDKLLYRDLPLGIDWSLLAVRGEWILIGLVLIGATAALFRDALPSLFAGALIAGLVALVSALAFSATNLGVKAIVLIFGLVPMAVLSLPVTLLLRWLVDKHEQALESRSFLRVASLLLLAIVIGVISGYFFKMSARTLDATRFMNTTLQTASQDSKSPVRNLPSFQQHAGMKYQLLHKASATSTEGFDVRAEYEDGYTVQCTVVVYPDTNPYISDCTSLQK